MSRGRAFNDYDTTNTKWGLSLATSGDRYLATSGDFFMATDNSSTSTDSISCWAQRRATARRQVQY